MNLFALAALIAVAFAVEAAVGFGSTVVVLTVGALVFPLDALMAVVVPVNVVLSTVLFARDRRAADLRFLAAQVLPAMLLGMAVGLGLAGLANGRLLKLGYAIFVVALAALELARKPRDATELSRPAALGWLTAGGVAHGAFAASGPLVVWVVGRALPDKRAFRATLAALWLALNLAWLAGASLRHLLDPQRLGTSALMLPAMAVGLFAGDALHRKLDAARFRQAVFMLMLAGGLVLFGSAALGA